MSILPESLHKRNTIDFSRSLTQFISAGTAILVFLLAVGAFILSYNALQELSYNHGYADWRSYIVPLLIDFALIVFSLAALRNSLLGESVVWPWTLVILFTATTVGFNVLHAEPTLLPKTIITRILGVVPPIALFLSFETLMSQVKSETNRMGLRDTNRQLAAEKEDLQQEISGRNASLDKLQESIINLQNKQKEMEQTSRQKLDTLQTIDIELQTQIEQKKAELSQLQHGKTPETSFLPANVPVKRDFIPGDAAALEQANLTRTEKMDRRRAELEEMWRNGVRDVDTLAAHFRVHTKTINRDLESLDLKESDSNSITDKPVLDDLFNLIDTDTAPISITGHYGNGRG